MYCTVADKNSTITPLDLRPTVADWVLKGNCQDGGAWCDLGAGYLTHYYAALPRLAKPGLTAVARPLIEHAHSARG